MEKQLLHESRTELKLRPYQKDCLTSIKQEKLRQLISLPTASGKTVIFANLIKDMNYPRTLIFVHTDELMLQAKEKIEMICPGISIGLVNSTKKEFEKTIVISSIQAAYVSSNLKKLTDQNFKLCVYDECHRAAADGARKVLNNLGFGKGTTKLLAGFTATPMRSDRKGLAEIFDVVSYEKPIAEMIKEGYLVKPICFKIKTDLDLSSVKTIDGDFGTTSLAMIMNTPEMNQLVVKMWLDKAYGRQTICFGVDVRHAKALAEEFQRQGISAQAIHGTMPNAKRHEIIQQYKAGEIRVLTNCAVLTEGFDSPETSCIILAKPTRSIGLYTQIVGRGLRRAPWAEKSDCVVLDFGDKNHKIVSHSVLYHDQTTEEGVIQTPKDQNILLEHDDIPLTLDKELRSALINFDPILGDAWLWEKKGKSHILRSAEHIIEISPYGKHYKVIYSNGEKSHTIASKVTFEYAFSIAEDFANENKSRFTISDINAKWRSNPISPKQKEVFNKYGYHDGIESLTAGQASILIGSGIFNKTYIADKNNIKKEVIGV